MDVICMWKILLPFKFDICSGVELKEIIYDDVSILPTKTIGSKYFNSIEVKYITVIDDSLLCKDTYDFGNMIEFEKNLTCKIGVRVNSFVNAYYRQVEKHIINQIFNGDDFTTECQMLILNMEGQPLDGVLQSNGGVRALSQRDINRIIEDVNIQEKNITDEFFRMAFCFLENGYFEMSIMNLSMAFESLIKTLVFSHGILVQDLKGKGFLEKFFHDGLKLVKGASLKESEPNYYETLSIIFDARNEIAHGGRLQNVEYFEELNFYDVYNAVDDLIDDSEEIICWILSL